MAIDSNVLLKAIVPDVVGQAQRGFALGTTIRNAPLLRQMNEQKAIQNEQTIASGNIDAGEQAATAAYGLVGDVPITIDNYASVVGQLKNVGVPFDADDFELTEENVSNLNALVNYGKRKATSGGKQFADKAVFAERINPFTQKPEQGFAVRDESGTRFEAIEGDVIQERPEDKRQRDLQAKVDAERKILDIKNSGAPLAEQNKQLGAERAKILETTRSAGRQAVRSKSNLLRLNRALEAANTGRLAVARDILGDLIPNVKDVDAEVFNSLATQYALDELSRQSGTKTDFDFKKAAETQARLGNTKEANKAILNIALDRIDEIEFEDKQLKNFVKNGGNPEDFEFKPIPNEFIQLLRSNPTNEQMKKDFKEKYGFVPTGL